MHSRLEKCLFALYSGFHSIHYFDHMSFILGCDPYFYTALHFFPYDSYFALPLGISVHSESFSCFPGCARTLRYLG